MSEGPDDHRPFSAGGVIPSLALKAELGPPRSECGVGALMPWAGRLWAVTYVSHKKGTGVGTGLYEITDDFTLLKHPESRVGTYTNRAVHYPSNQLVIGPHVIDADRNVRTVEELTDVRLCSTMRHLERPDDMVYMLGMEGEFFEMNVETLEVRRLFDLTEELGVEDPPFVHFKAGYSALGRVLVASNNYTEEDFLGKAADGRLAEWHGDEWRVLERKPFVEVTGRGGFAGTMFATGWDRASAILKVYTEADDTWRTYRLPKASHTFDHAWQTEWPRIRETEHERCLMDCHGMFYELSPWAYGNRVWGVRPISTHLWVMGDFCSWRGMLVLGADNASPSGGSNHLVGEPQSGLWFGKTDDLWQFGKPSGWGGPWWKETVEAGRPSDPFLMTGFDRKVLHLSHGEARKVTFTVEVDFLGDGSWRTYETFEVGAAGYVHHEFPPGFSAHWVRVTADADCRATAHFHYT
ncbi:MAG: hypothetical protein R6X33_03750 [Candidatus Brocadiia bacterium]